MRVDCGELEGDPVVLPQPERVHGGQARLLIHAVISSLTKGLRVSGVAT
jgi:hypothetical protein